MANQDCRHAICSPGQQLFNCQRVRRDARRTAQEPSHSGHHHPEVRIAKKGRGQKSMPLVLDQQAGDSQVSDADQALRIAAVARVASDCVWPRLERLVDGDWWAE
jgi:hypothetical protein